MGRASFRHAEILATLAAEAKAQAEAKENAERERLAAVAEEEARQKLAAEAKAQAEAKENAERERLAAVAEEEARQKLAAEAKAQAEAKETSADAPSDPELPSVLPAEEAGGEGQRRHGSGEPVAGQAGSRKRK